MTMQSIALACFGIYALTLAACAHGNAPATSPSNDDEPIDIELNGVEMHDALAAIAMKARINVFSDPDITDNVTLRAQRTPWRDVLAKLANEHGLRIESLVVKGIPRPSMWITRQSSPAAPTTEFTGSPIDDKFIDIPIRDAAARLSVAAKIPIVVDDDVQASVEMYMRNTPWDLALYHMAQKYQLRVVRTANELRITRR
jgi:type II secretory pathway component HofQ